MIYISTIYFREFSELSPCCQRGFCVSGNVIGPAVIGNHTVQMMHFESSQWEIEVHFHTERLHTLNTKVKFIQLSADKDKPDKVLCIQI